MSYVLLCVMCHVLCVDRVGLMNCIPFDAKLLSMDKGPETSPLWESDILIAELWRSLWD